MDARRCSALFISAPASGQGKTTVTAALAFYHRQRGRRVRVFKAGPDFLDPMILERASGHPVHQLDLWMMGEAQCHRLLYEAAGCADLILVEGVMGLFDGTPSSADLAQRFGIPVVAVIDSSAMAQTFAAVAHGLSTFRPGLGLWGVVANGVASPRHAEMLTAALSPALRFLGGLARSEAIALPSRHLGLTQAQEIADLDARLAAAAASLAMTEAVKLLPQLELEAPPAETVPPLLAGVRIAVARDAAFSFLYPANLELLCALGARLSFFSPIADGKLPPADSVYLPGGYPELHLAELEANEPMKAALRAHFEAGKPLYAECGGMLYLLEALTDQEGRQGKMVGLLPGRAVMQRRLQAIGYQEAEFVEGVLRGHTFHHSVSRIDLPPADYARHPQDGKAGEALYRGKGLFASYVHFYFPSNPLAAARLFLP